MTRPRIVSGPAAVTLIALAAGWIPASGQSVVSTHSGVLYFFEGSVFIDGERLEQKFGRFPDIGEGGELRTERGRAEVLLTPGVFLRIGDNSSIRMLSTQFSDTRVELLGGSAIVESKEATLGGPGTSVKLIYKNWQVGMTGPVVYRLNAEPSQVQVYKGRAEVSAEGESATVTANEGEVLPLAGVLVPERSSVGSDDAFKSWAMSRSDAIAADNTIAEGIVDDPGQIDNSGLAQGGFSYYPPSPIPYLTGPYGLSFWSPYQSMWSSIYLPMYMYRLYPGWPSMPRYQPLLGRAGVRGTLPPGRIGGISRPGIGITPVGITPRSPIGIRPATVTPAPHVSTPHVGAAHAGGGHR